MKHIFGPVPSRRLGRSLGVDLVPMKTCTLSCRYCQVGPTPETVTLRREYFPADEILSELKARLASGVATDWITMSGSGEPTLNSAIGRIIDKIKQMTATPVCVITNGTLMNDPAVRRDLLNADAVMPSLDSAVEETFRAMCRPHPDIHVTNIVSGLESFRREFNGLIWLEILFMAGVNDSPTELAALKTAIGRIEPDSVQLNTVVRPPADSDAQAVSQERLEEIRQYFGDRAEIIATFKGVTVEGKPITRDDVAEYLKRRPGTTDDIAVSLGADRAETERHLKSLERDGLIRLNELFGKKFWEYLHAQIQ